MASPARPAGPDRERGRRKAGLEVVPTAVRSVPAAAPAGRLRAAGAPELVSDDDHPDFHHLPTFRGRR
ncbi:MAG: hypothetical protein ABIR83_02090 [Nakamurella sp.]